MTNTNTIYRKADNEVTKYKDENIPLAQFMGEMDKAKDDFETWYRKQGLRGTEKRGVFEQYFFHFLVTKTNEMELQHKKRQEEAKEKREAK